MKRILLVLCALWVTACTHGLRPGGATALYLVEQDTGEEPFRTRMIVTDGYLRIDDGTERGDFLLYDRRAHTIYNVSATDRLVIVIGNQPVTQVSPIPLTHTSDPVADATVPNVGGKKVAHYRLRTNGDTCYDLYAADGLLPDAVAALTEYRRVLAGEQAVALSVTPRELQTPCDLANHVYEPARHLAYGFPIRLSETTRTRGLLRTTELVDYREDFAAGAALFELPADYRRIRIEELRGR